MWALASAAYALSQSVLSAANPSIVSIRSTRIAVGDPPSLETAREEA
jgi:hypothetical protein